MARNNLIDIYEAKGRYSEAFEQSLAQFKRPERIKELQLAFEKDGYKGFVQKLLDRQLDRQRTDLEKDNNAYLRGFGIAINYARLQNKDKAFEYLNKAYEQREPQMAEIKVEPIFEFLRDDPRFKAMLKRMNLPE